MNCINKNDKNFIKLLEESNLPAVYLEFVISKYQQENNTFDFPTLEEILKYNKTFNKIQGYGSKNVDVNSLTVPEDTDYTEQKISIPGQSVEEKPQDVPIKEGVTELFESNPELANVVYEALGFNNLRKEYSNIIIAQVWKRLADEGITNADSLIGTRDTINNKDFNKFWSAVKDIDIQNVIKFFESEKQKALDSYSKYKGEFDPTTGTFTSNDTSFFDKKIKDLETLLQQKQQAQQLYSQYLNTIFPDSKVKDIVYHGTPHGKFEKFNKEYLHTGDRVSIGFYFLNNIENVKRYLKGEFKEGNKPEIIQAVVNATNPKSQNRNFVTIEEGLKILEELKGDITEEEYKQAKRRIEESFNGNVLLSLLFKDIIYDRLKEDEHYEKFEEDKTFHKTDDFVKKFIKITGVDSFFQGETVFEDSNSQIVLLLPEQIHILGSKADIEGFKDFVQGKQFQKLTEKEKARTIEQVTKEHRSITALKDLAAKLTYRIGGKVEFVNKTDVDWKGYNQGMKSVLNEAYMTPDTPFHEILAHPIIKAIKESDFYKKVNNSYDFIEWVENNKPEYKPAPFMEGIMSEKRLKEAYDKYGKEFEKLYPNKSNTFNSLYQSLLKELETSRGKEVFEQVKRDYKIVTQDDINKAAQNYINNRALNPFIFESLRHNKNVGSYTIFGTKGETLIASENEIPYLYTLEEQQEEAIVTLLGMLAADKLDAKKDTTLISKLKELWKQISDFVKSLLRQDGIKIDELPISTTLNDLAEIMAYGNNKIILPGYKVEYSTPLGNKYDTLEEVNNELRGLADANTEVDLSGVNIYNSKITKDNLPKDFVKTFGIGSGSSVFLADNKYNDEFNEKNRLLREKYKDKFVVAPKDKYGLYLDHYNENQIFYNTKEEAEEKALDLSIENYNKNNQLSGFIEKNKEYEQSKEIIEQWKKENNIQYNPEEIYSRGQGFYSSIGAYSNLELDLLLKNLIQHIEDNKKAGGEFTISAFTKPIDKRLKHIEGTGDRVRFVIYPQSEHIKWAAPTDVYSGSVWDAHEKVSKDKKSELLGVSFTKAPALRNINEVSPNLADIIDNLSHAHNELGIELTTNNFRIEYDDNIDYSTKKLIDNINKILDDKYGKLTKPEIKIDGDVKFALKSELNNNVISVHNTEEEAKIAWKELGQDRFTTKITKSKKYSGKQPAQTKENTTSIESVKNNLGVFDQPNDLEIEPYGEGYSILFKGELFKFNTYEDALNWVSNKFPKNKEYTSQAKINLKVAALKEVVRKYPRSLITSKVVPINPNLTQSGEIQYSKKQENNTFDFPTLEEILKSNKVAFNLKSIDILQSDKALQVFTKGLKNNWPLDKILSELQIPKEQKQLILDLGITDREQIALELASKYSYTVEINTAKDASEKAKKDSWDRAIEQGLNPWEEGVDNDFKGENTQYYSNLTVPGGTNYTENEIVTPAITPSIKGHAQFSTDNGIGWFRSDDKTIDELKGNWVKRESELPNEFVYSGERYFKKDGEWQTEKRFIEDIETVIWRYNMSLGNERTQNKPESKTRRILEVQSDLFQKWRNNFEFEDNKYTAKKDDKNIWHYYKNVNEINANDYTEVWETFLDTYLDNADGFIKLLQKNNNWVTFFVKSIIQDSAKKGYEKVLFPSGNTASKVEGHTTLEEFKKQKEDRIKELETNASKYESFKKLPIIERKRFDGSSFYYFEGQDNFTVKNSKEELFNEVDKYVKIWSGEKIQQEIDHLKQELERVEREGFGALKPIYNFYENTVTNILKKQGYSPVLITDEYGNTWNEINITPQRDLNPVVFAKVDKSFIDNKTNDLFPDVQKDERVTTSEESLNRNLQILFGKTSNIDSFSSNEVVNNIISYFETNNEIVSEEFKDFINRLSKINSKTKLNVFFVSDEIIRSLDKNNDTGNLVYDPKTHRIYINKDLLSELSSEQVLFSFLHEMNHSTTYYFMLNNEDELDENFTKEANKAFEYFKSNSNNSKAYGFTTVFEFVSEIFSNPNFRKELQEIENKQEIKKENFLKKLINYIRQKLGLSKTKENTNVVSTVTLFNMVDEYSTIDRTYFKGVNNLNNEFTLDAAFIKFSNNEVKTELKTLEDKLLNVKDNLIVNIDTNIRKYQNLIDISDRKKDEKQKANYQKTLENLTTLKQNILSLEEVDYFKGVVYFLEYMDQGLIYAEKAIENMDYDSPDLKRKVRNLDELLKTYEIVTSINDLVSATLTDKTQALIGKGELKLIQEQLEKVKSKYDSINSRLFFVKKEALKQMLNNIKYFPKVESKHYNRLSKEHSQNKIPVEKETWILDKMQNRDKEIIESDLKEALTAFLENPLLDVNTFSVNFSHAVNVSNPLVQIFNLILQEIDNKRIKEESLFDQQYEKLFNKLKSEKNSTDLKELYGNLIEFNSEGVAFIKGEYKVDFLDKVVKPIKNLRLERKKLTENIFKEGQEIKTQYGSDSLEYNNFLKDSKTKIKTIDDKIKKLEKENYDILEDGSRKIKDKWLNNISSLSTVEKEVLQEFKRISYESSKNLLTYGDNSLLTFHSGAVFYELPKVTKNDYERTLNLDFGGIVKDKFTDITNQKVDDFDFEKQERNLANEVVKRLRPKYRGNIKPEDQSLDLFGIYRLEYKNGNMAKVRREYETDLGFLIDLSKRKLFYDGKTVNKDTGKLNLIQGEFSNTHKMLNNLLESKFYDILRKTDFKVGNVDLHKVVDKINGVQSFLSMSLNVSSGIANVLNARTQLFLESFIKGHHISSAGIAKANSFYRNYLAKDWLTDMNSGIKRSKLSQILEMFNIKGELNLNEHDFLKNSLLKKGFSSEALQVFQSSGEHYIQSITTLSVLEGIKVLNSNNKFINKEGKVVNTKEEAASVLDMLYLDEAGILQMNPKVVFTTHSRLTPWESGGKEKVDLLLYKKIYDTIGAYRKTDQADMYRTWWGALFGMYRKFFVPMGIARFRGFSNAFKSNVSEEDLDYSYALQEYEEGTYTSLVKYLVKVLKSKSRFLAMSSEWENLTDYQKHNLKRAVTEIIITLVLLPLIRMFIVAKADDDDEKAYFIAYQIRRIETELSTYRNPSEFVKMLRSPIPSARILDLGAEVLIISSSPWDWDKFNDTYERGDYKNENKLKIKLLKMTPLVKDFMKNNKDKYEFQDNSFGGGLF